MAVRGRIVGGNLHFFSKNPTNEPSGIAHTFREELGLTARLGAPLALGELGWMSTYIVDALMVGRLPHSALAISASSLGNTIFYTVAFCAVRLLTGLDTVVAQSYGRGDSRTASNALAQAMWIVLAGTPIVILLTLGFLSLLPHFGSSPEIVAETGRYIHALVWSTGPLLLYMALRQYLQATNRAILIMLSLLSAGLVNFVGDWTFLFGHLGIHAQGIAGSGWATCIVRVWMLLVILPGIVSGLRENGDPPRLSAFRPDWRQLRVQLRVGWPASLQNVTDLGFSTFMSIVCARLGTTMLAAHQVTLDLDAFIYQVPAGLAFATITRVGQSAGRNSLTQVLRASRASLTLCLLYVAVAASLFAGFARFWAGLYTNDGSVVAIAAPIFLICAFIQLGDGAAVIYGSAMTGLGDTRTPLIVNTVWFWVIAMPSSYLLAFNQGLALEGLWIGRAIGALGTALTLTLLWHHRTKQMRDSPASSRSLSLLAAE
jgi:MATE family multidrug resistance protein